MICLTKFLIQFRDLIVDRKGKNRNVKKKLKTF